ncbi:prohibitin family protein [Methylobacter tundripaludum]|nr:prohibitin family protein [Methylobacter tundripaludum]
MMTITLTVMIMGLLFVYLSPTMMVTIPAGHLGVRWYRFHGGTDQGPAVQEGTRLKFPWDELYDYDARVQLVDKEYDLITKDGLLITTHISFLYRIEPETLGILHKEVGPDFLNVVLIPELGAVARTVVAEYGAEEFYSTRRIEARDRILAEMRQRLIEDNAYSPDNVVLIEFDRVMLRSIKLPDRIANAIEAKVEQYQRQLEYDFRLQVETKEKERKRIEGEGVQALFDNIGAKEVPNYLRLVGINATLELARSNNAKIIVTGSSLNALPLLIGNDALPPPAQQPQAVKIETTKGANQSPPQLLKAPSDNTKATSTQAEKPATQTDKTQTDKAKK